MKTCTRLSANELVDMVAAVCEYNGLEPKVVRFVDDDDLLIEPLWCEIECESPGLAVRTSDSQQETDRLAAQTDAVGRMVQ